MPHLRIARDWGRSYATTDTLDLGQGKHGLLLCCQRVSNSIRPCNRLSPKHRPLHVQNFMTGNRDVDEKQKGEGLDWIGD